MDKRRDNSQDLVDERLKLHQYEIRRFIKEVRKSWVFQAHDLEIERDVALKILKPGQKPEREEQFLREGRRLGELGKHKYIPTIYAARRDNGYYYIAMELVEGEDLEDIIKSGRTFSIEKIVNIIDCVTEALSFSHTKGIRHEDIKLENIMEEEEGISYIVDFGNRLTRDNSSDDIFSVGVVFNQLLNHRDNNKERVPKKLEQIIERALRRDYDETYETIDELRDDIEDYKRSISRREFLEKAGIIIGGCLFLPSMSYGLYRYLTYKNSMNYIVDEISKVESTDYENISPLFRELLVRIIDHKIDWLVESGIVSKRKFPYATIENGSWFLTNGEYWSDGFWPGILWQCYEVTGKEKCKEFVNIFIKDKKLRETRVSPFIKKGTVFYFVYIEYES